MARGGASSSSNKCVTAVLRGVPAVLLPLVVTLVQPRSVAGGTPIVLVAAALGIVVSAALPHGRLAFLTTALAGTLLVGAALLQQPLEAASDAGWPQAAQFRGAPQASAGQPRTASEAAVAAAAPAAEPDAPVALETMSIVLPCAYEGAHAARTVEAIWAHTKHERLKEILVVDDGSQPPLSLEFPQSLLRGGPGRPDVKLLRHDKTLGLIAAKKTGGDAATGDVIVFFDCHIRPRDGWEEAFLRQMKRRGDHRTVVVPTITALDEATWEETDTAGHSKACYMLWNGDFTWLANPGRDVPIMSGGLLALSRRWWQETGGYDTEMVAWGGENIDQSLRAWLCGGRIELAEGAYVAHMWRDPNNPATQLKYPMPTEAVMRNKARALTAWLGEFLEKAMAFPEYEAFVKKEQSIGNMSNFAVLKDKLKCAPFSSYIQRFSYVYLDSGLIPAEVFQVREESTGLCLEREPRDGHVHGVILAPCVDNRNGKPGVEEVQLWNWANRDRAKPDAPCCSGLMNWNFLQCLDGHAVGGVVQTFECDISGYSSSTQGFGLQNFKGSHQLMWQRGTGCLAPVQPQRQPDRRKAELAACGLQVEEQGDSHSIRLRTPGPDDGALCVTEVPASSGSETQLELSRCDGSDSQVFRTGHTALGLKVMTPSGQCFDIAGGTRMLVYMCYPDSIANQNQAFEIIDGRLFWEGQAGGALKGFCLHASSAALDLKSVSVTPQFTLKSCTDKVGQRFKREDRKADGRFLLRDVDSGKCLTVGPGGGGGLERVIKLGPCSNQYWRSLPEEHQVQHVSTRYCLDAGAQDAPIVYPCHTPKALRKQRFQVVDTPGWVQLARGWEDNGRKVFFERCLDYAPEPSVSVSIQRCDSVARQGVRWSRTGIRTSPEYELWQRVPKPPPGAAPLGGDAQPP